MHNDRREAARFRRKEGPQCLPCWTQFWSSPNQPSTKKEAEKNRYSSLTDLGMRHEAAVVVTSAHHKETVRTRLCGPVCSIYEWHTKGDTVHNADLKVISTSLKSMNVPLIIHPSVQLRTKIHELTIPCENEVTMSPGWLKVGKLINFISFTLSQDLLNITIPNDRGRVQERTDPRVFLSTESINQETNVMRERSKANCHSMFRCWLLSWAPQSLPLTGAVSFSWRIWETHHGGHPSQNLRWVKQRWEE